MSHSLGFIPKSIEKKIFFIFLALTLGLFGVFRWLDAPLRTPVAPSGIVSFELANTTAQAESIIRSWDVHARLFAAFGLGLDYLFMPVYALTLSLGILMVLRKHGGGLFGTLGNYLGWGALIAACFDAIENIALWQLLTGVATPYFPRIAAVAAAIKFMLLLVGVLFSLLGWLLPKKKS
jgi:hypothetical protein